jgi:hypothetical protein
MCVYALAPCGIANDIEGSWARLDLLEIREGKPSWQSRVGNQETRELKEADFTVPLEWLQRTLE